MDEIPLIDPPIRSTTLPDGRSLTWQEFGQPDGRPALYCHGGGSCSVEGAVFHREAVRRNIRLIATNRPGALVSSACPGRPVAAYSDDLTELLDRLDIDRFACLGESNGGMVTLAVAATMATRVLGAVPINPTVPWFDPAARSVTPGGAGMAYRMMKHAPWLLAWLAGRFSARFHKPVPEAPTFDRSHLIGPPPGTEPDVAEILVTMIAKAGKGALRPELEWASSDWGVDYYAIPVPLDFFCGAYDAQAPFALVLASRNPNARFHHFAYGHQGFLHPDARRRIIDTIAGYFGD